jgi:hypothetical protein
MQGTFKCYGDIIIFRNEAGKFFADYTIIENKLTLSFSHTGSTGIWIKIN